MSVSSTAKPRRGLRGPRRPARAASAAPFRLLRRGSEPAAVAPREPRPQPERRADPAPEDRAIYTCACGLVFSAAVSTSVDCPHCGHAQAW
jgi:hypothetical protein